MDLNLDSSSASVAEWAGVKPRIEVWEAAVMENVKTKARMERIRSFIEGMRFSRAKTTTGSAAAHRLTGSETRSHTSTLTTANSQKQGLHKRSATLL